MRSSNDPKIFFLFFFKFAQQDIKRKHLQARWSYRGGIVRVRGTLSKTDCLEWSARMQLATPLCYHLKQIWL